MRTIDQVLDRAKKVQKVPSDYKLALCTGIGEKALANYRHGRSLPDDKTCEKLAVAMGEDPIVLMVEMQAQRTKDDSARAKWVALAKRLQMGFSSDLFSCVLAIVAIASSALPAKASTVSVDQPAASLYIMLSTAKGLKSLFLCLFVIFGNFMGFLPKKGNFQHV